MSFSVVQKVNVSFILTRGSSTRKEMRIRQNERHDDTNNNETRRKNSDLTFVL